MQIHVLSSRPKMCLYGSVHLMVFLDGPGGDGEGVRGKKGTETHPV